MVVLKKTILRFFRELYLLKVDFIWLFLGIEYVSREVSRCPKYYVASLLRRYGATVSETVNFKDSVQIDNASGDKDATGNFSNLRIGKNCYIGKGVFFDLPHQIIIEDECAISAGVKFITHQDCGKRVMSRWYPRQLGDVVIGYGTWIGVNAVVLHGVTLGKCCVVAAGSVVTDSFPDYSVVAGIPAKVIKKLSSEGNE